MPDPRSPRPTSPAESPGSGLRVPRTDEPAGEIPWPDEAATSAGRTSSVPWPDEAPWPEDMPEQAAQTGTPPEADPRVSRRRGGRARAEVTDAQPRDEDAPPPWERAAATSTEDIAAARARIREQILSRLNPE